jgi:hypothetical protein
MIGVYGYHTLIWQIQNCGQLIYNPEIFSNVCQILSDEEPLTTGNEAGAGFKGRPSYTVTILSW